VALVRAIIDWLTAAFAGGTLELMVPRPSRGLVISLGDIAEFLRRDDLPTGSSPGEVSACSATRSSSCRPARAVPTQDQRPVNLRRRAAMRCAGI